MLSRLVRTGPLILLLLMGVAASRPADAVTITVPIPELITEIVSNSPILLINVELNAEFLDISHVSLSITAVGIPQVFRRCQLDGCTEFEVPPELVFLFDREETLPIRLIFAATPEFSSDPATFVVDIPDPRGAPPFEFLLDGEVKFQVSFNDVFFIPGDIVFPVSPGSVLVSYAEINVTGQPIPEPTTSGMVLLGLIVLSCRQRRITTATDGQIQPCVVD